MILDFNTIPANAVPHFAAARARPSSVNLTIPAWARWRLTPPVGSSIGLHTHTGNCEVIYILSGSGQHRR